jgi:hypothetical protein
MKSDGGRKRDVSEDCIHENVGSPTDRNECEYTAARTRVSSERCRRTVTKSASLMATNCRYVVA